MEENSLDKQYKLIGHLLKGLEKMHLGYLLAEKEEVDDSKLKNQPSNRIFNDHLIYHYLYPLQNCTIISILFEPLDIHNGK